MRGVTPVGSGLSGGGGGVKSVQRGTISIAGAATSNTATITGVSLTNSVLRYLGTEDQSGDTTPNKVACRIAFTNATTITATVNTAGAGPRVVSFEVIEYNTGVIKSIQRGTVTTTANNTGTATISAVTTTKSTLDFLGFTTTYSGGTIAGHALADVILTNATTVTANGLGSLDRTVGYQVVEWN